MIPKIKEQVPLVKRLFRNPKNRALLLGCCCLLKLISLILLHCRRKGRFCAGGRASFFCNFSFPVFCLICPVGLTFAFIIGIVHMLKFNDPTITPLVILGVLFSGNLLFEKMVSIYLSNRSLYFFSEPIK